MGKHDMAAPISESLERHYQEQIKLLEQKLEVRDRQLADAEAQIEMLRLHVQTDEKKIEEYRNALVEQTLLATARKR